MRSGSQIRKHRALVQNLRRRGHCGACPISSRPRISYGKRHNPGLSDTPVIGGGRTGMIEAAFWEEMRDWLCGELAMLGAAVQVGLFGQRRRRRIGTFGTIRL
jgi:hypothetical protein